MSKKDLNFELNLLPVISLLAVLICFLLLTTAWIHIASVDVSQAIGGQSQAETKKQPELWISLNGKKLTYEIKNVSKKLKRYNQRKSINVKYAPEYFKRLKSKIENLNVALISPSKSTEYAHVIAMIDNLKQEKINEIGVNPL